MMKKRSSEKTREEQHFNMMNSLNSGIKRDAQEGLAKVENVMEKSGEGDDDEEFDDFHGGDLNEKNE